MKKTIICVISFYVLLVSCGSKQNEASAVLEANNTENIEEQTTTDDKNAIMHISPEDQLFNEIDSILNLLGKKDISSHDIQLLYDKASKIDTKKLSKKQKETFSLLEEVFMACSEAEAEANADIY